MPPHPGPKVGRNQQAGSGRVWEMPTTEKAEVFSS